MLFISFPSLSLGTPLLAKLSLATIFVPKYNLGTSGKILILRSQAHESDRDVEEKQPTVSFELFPARNAEAAEKLDRVIDQLAVMEPDFVSVTFGAGGSTREGSRQLVETLKNDLKLEVMAYFAGYGLGPDDIQGVMDSYLDLGVDNVLVVRGDPPHGQPDFKPHSASLAHASDMLEFIRPRYSFCLGAAGYPEGHIEAESQQKDLEYLKLKVDNGAELYPHQLFLRQPLLFRFCSRTVAAWASRSPLCPASCRFSVSR